MWLGNLEISKWPAVLYAGVALYSQIETDWVIRTEMGPFSRELSCSMPSFIHAPFAKNLSRDEPGRREGRRTMPPAIASRIAVK